MMKWYGELQLIRAQEVPRKREEIAVEVQQIASSRIAPSIGGQAKILESGGGGGTTTDDRCPDAVCSNQPDTMSLSFVISGYVVTSEICNNEEDYSISASGETGEIDVTDQDDGGNCDQYSIATDDIPFSYTCINPDCSSSFNFVGQAILTCGAAPAEDDNWSLQINLDGLGSVCSDFPFGGDQLVLVDIGTDPTGTHTFSLDDPNLSTVHYEFTVVIT